MSCCSASVSLAQRKQQFGEPTAHHAVCVRVLVHLAEARQFQVRLQIAQRAGDVVQVIRQQAAIAQLAQRRRRRRQQQLGDVACLRERPHVHVEHLQVQQHADDDLHARGRRQQ